MRALQIKGVIPENLDTSALGPPISEIVFSHVMSGKPVTLQDVLDTIVSVAKENDLPVHIEYKVIEI